MHTGGGQVSTGDVLSATHLLEHEGHHKHFVTFLSIFLENNGFLFEWATIKPLEVFHVKRESVLHLQDFSYREKQIDT